MNDTAVEFGQAALSAVCETALFRGYSKEEATVLCSSMQPNFKLCPKGSMILSEGAPAQRIGFVQSGIISATRNSSDGQAHILEFHESGELIALDSVCGSKQTSLVTYTALEDSVVLLLNLEQILSGGVKPFVSNLFLRNVTQLLADKCDQLLSKTELLSKRALRDRIMTFLRIMQRQKGGKPSHLRMDREQLAQYLCVNRSALSRELHEMQRDGLIRLEENGRITMRQ